MDEIALVKSAQQGDLDSFNRLVLFHQDSVYNLACRILSDSDLASDAAQATFISAYRNLSQFRGGSFKAWLMRMASNNCLDELRRQKRHPHLSLEPLNQEGEEEVENPVWLKDDSPTPESAFEMKELEMGIQHCIDQLPPEFKIVVLLVDVEGLDYAEASLSIQKPLGTVKSRLARARTRMQDCLRGFRELLPAEFRLEKEESL